MQGWYIQVELYVNGFNEYVFSQKNIIFTNQVYLFYYTQLFTEYGKLAMEESNIKPFQVKQLTWFSLFVCLIDWDSISLYYFIF